MTAATNAQPLLRWRHFDAESLGDAASYGRQSGQVAVMDSASQPDSVLVYAANEATMRTAMRALNLDRVIPRGVDPGRSWWLHGVDAITARDRCAADEAARLYARGEARKAAR
jgi:hypothetical protein